MLRHVVFIGFLLLGGTLSAEVGSNKILLNPASVPSCGASMKNGMMHFPGCRNGLMVASTFGRRFMTCSEIDGIRFVGPVFINDEGCDQVLHGLTFCDIVPMDSSPVARPCRDSLHWSSSAVLVFIGVLVATEIVIYRLVRLFHCYRKGDYKLAGVQRVDGGFEFQMMAKFWSGGARITSAGIPLSDGFSELKTKKFKMSFFQVLLYCFFLWNPILVSAGSHEIFMGHLSNVSIHGFRLESNDVHVSLPLTLLHYTSEFWDDTYDKEVYHREDCPSCLKASINPIRVYKEFTVRNGVCSMQMMACQPRGSGTILDLLSNSCRLRMMTIKWKAENAVSVYTPGNGLSFGGAHTASKNCQIKGQTSLIPLSVPGSFYKTPRKGWFYCPLENPFGGKIPGALNSFKFNWNGEYDFPDNFINCNSHETHGLSCILTNYNLTTHMQQCHKLPALVNGLLFDVGRGGIEIRRKPSLRVDIECADLEEPINECGSLEFSVTGHTSGPHGILMTLTPEKKVDAFWEGFVQCLGENMTIPCDGEGFALIVSPDSPCINATPIQKRHIFGPEHFDIATVKSVGFESGHVDSGDFFSNISSFMKWWPMKFIASSPILMFVILLILLKLF